MKLLLRLRLALRFRHYSPRTEEAYCQWIRRFVCFHKLRNPAHMAEPEIDAFLTHLLESGYDIRVIQEWMGNGDVHTNMIYRHVLNRGGQGVRSPIDNL